MRTILFSAALILVFVASALATPFYTMQFGAVPPRALDPDRQVCHLAYFNFCSNWTLAWEGYCGTLFSDAVSPPQWGVCFDLSDCPVGFRGVYDVWWAWECLQSYGNLDIEIYCADEACCPVGSPIAGMYGYSIKCTTYWNHIDFGGAETCGCDDTGGKFIILFTDNGFAQYSFPLSDNNALNIDDGCETEWRCTGHSFVYRNAMDYCAVYGEPALLWISNPAYYCTNTPQIPDGCFNYDFRYDRPGVPAEWITDAYVHEIGGSAVEESSWTGIKAQYR